MEEPTLGSLDWTCHEAGNLSPRQILRMANEGKFPQPVRVTEGNDRQRGRIAFVRSEVRTWVAERIAERDKARLERASGGSLAQNDSTAAKPKISHIPPGVRYRVRRRPGPRPTPTPGSR
jgi:predicted DNA-binding transcriptional regulator AlpA